MEVFNKPDILSIPLSIFGCDALVPHHFFMVHLHNLLIFGFSGVGFENYRCNFTVMSCFDLLVIVTRMIFGFAPVTTLLKILLCGLVGRA